MSNKLTDEQISELERAATSLLTDDEIISSVKITAQQLSDNYNIIESARLKLKQRLNAKRISDAATGDGSIDKVLANIPVNNKNKQKGKTNNPNGRPKGSSNKISGQAILEAIEQHDIPFEIGLAQDYARARAGEDRHLVAKYQQLILNKVVADKSAVDITSGGEVIKAAFAFVPAELPEWKKPEEKI